MSPSLIELQGVSMTFRSGRRVVRAVSDVDLRIAAGMSLAIVGESGSGKSTLADIVVGTLAPTSGTLLLDGRPLRARRRRAERRRIQLVQQNPMTALNPRLTIGSSVGLPIWVHRLRPRQAIRQRVTELLAAVGVSADYLHRYPGTLSGGQRQRVALARAMAAEPDLVVLDEPTSALDVSVQARVLELLAREKQEGGRTYLFITHDLGVARVVATHVAVLYRGRIVELATAAALFDRPRHWYTILLLSSVPVVTAEEAAARPAWPATTPRSATAAGGEERGCVFRARCPAALPVCASEAPKLTPAAGHAVACHNPSGATIAWPKA